MKSLINWLHYIKTRYIVSFHDQDNEVIIIIIIIIIIIMIIIIIIIIIIKINS